MTNSLDSFEAKLRNNMFNRANVYEAVNSCVREMGQSRYLHEDKSADKAGCKLYKTTVFYTFGITAFRRKKKHMNGWRSSRSHDIE